MLGDCGIGDRVESRIVPCSGISGVMRGEERGGAEIEGDTAGNIVGENTIVALRDPIMPEEALRADTSEDDRLRTLAAPFPLLMSMWAGALPRCSRCWGSWPFGSRARRAACRCSSRMNPWNKFRKTHFPMFTAPFNQY